jgi:hypothetical protein
MYSDYAESRSTDSDFDDDEPLEAKLPSIRSTFEGMHRLEGRFSEAEVAFDRALRAEMTGAEADQWEARRTRRAALSALKSAAQAVEDKLAASSAAVGAHVAYAMTRSVSASAKWAYYDGEASDAGGPAWWERQGTLGPTESSQELQTPPALATADHAPKIPLMRPCELPSPPSPAPASSSSELSSASSLEYLSTRNTPDVASGSESNDSGTSLLQRNTASHLEHVGASDGPGDGAASKSSHESGAEPAAPIDSLSPALDVDQWMRIRASRVYVDETPSSTEYPSLTRRRTRELKRIFSHDASDAASGSESSGRGALVDENAAAPTEFELQEELRHAKRLRTSPHLSGARLASPVDSISSSLDRWKRERLSRARDETPSPAESSSAEPNRKRSGERL